MNYIKKYISLCKKLKTRKVEPHMVYEKHHCFPVSIFGDNDFVIHLTPKEHYIAHLLLWKAYRKRYGILDVRTRKMAVAFHWMIYGRSSARKSLNLISSLYQLARQAAVESKKGGSRPDMKGKPYFGASEEVKMNGIEKMRLKKIGMKISYPKNRRGVTCSKEKASKISKSRMQTSLKYVSMTSHEFAAWIHKQNLYRKDGARNGNVIRAILARQEKVEKYYVG